MVKESESRAGIITLTLLVDVGLLGTWPVPYSSVHNRFVVYLTTLSVSQSAERQMAGWLVNSKFKESCRGLIYLLSPNVSGRTEENHNKSRSGQPLPRLRSDNLERYRYISLLGRSQPSYHILLNATQPENFIKRCKITNRIPPRVEAGSNTSTVTLRVVGGDEKGSLKCETVKYGRESKGTRTKERLRWQGPTAYIKERPILSSERAPHKKKP
jgi:hypothetical protein